MISNIMRNRDEIRLNEEFITAAIYNNRRKYKKYNIYEYICLSKLNTSIYFKDKIIVEI